MTSRVDVPWPRLQPWLLYLAAASAVAFVTALPAPLLPVARAYAGLCERYPILALLTNHTPPLPLALLLSLSMLALLAGGRAGIAALFVTVRLRRHLRSCAVPVPVRLARVAGELGVANRLTFLTMAETMACCYGFLRPRIAVTASLVERLDDEELTAVLAHEREHLRRRDPLRYLMFEALTAAAFMFPIAPALRRRAEARIELAADQAALAVAPRAALAGALHWPWIPGSVLAARLGALVRQRAGGAPFLLGLAFGFAFCPTLLALFAGLLIPLALSRPDGVVYPALFALGTALPLLAILGLLSLGGESLRHYARPLGQGQQIVAVLAGVLLIVIGLNDTIVYWLL